jgi:hypothetical protein
MSTSGLQGRGRDAALRRTWQAPSLSVLVFRATANSSSTGNDSQTQGQIVSQSPPIPFSPPSPPPPGKGNLLCDGQVPAPGTGDKNAAQAAPGRAKNRGVNQDTLFVQPHTLDLCNAPAFLLT